MPQELAESIQNLVASPPTGTVAVEVEFARVTYHLHGNATLSQVVTRVSVVPEHSGDASDSDADEIDPSRMTALQRVRAHVAKHGNGERKPKEWAEMFFGCGGPSARELRRALKEDLLHYSVKPIGKDAGAQLVDSFDLIEYLIEREKVLTAEDPPAVWRKVIGTRLRSAA